MWSLISLPKWWKISNKNLLKYMYSKIRKEYDFQDFWPQCASTYVIWNWLFDKTFVFDVSFPFLIADAWNLYKKNFLGRNLSKSWFATFSYKCDKNVFFTQKCAIIIGVSLINWWYQLEKPPFLCFWPRDLLRSIISWVIIGWCHRNR